MLTAGQPTQLANHGSLWPKQLDQALGRRAPMGSDPSTDPDSAFTSFHTGEADVAETLILMEFADVGSLDHAPVRARFRQNLVRPPLWFCLPCQPKICLSYIQS